MPLPILTYRRRRYYIDYRLQQFRSIPRDFGRIEFVDFRSDKGDRMLTFMVKRKLPIEWSRLHI